MSKIAYFSLPIMLCLGCSYAKPESRSEPLVDSSVTSAAFVKQANTLLQAHPLRTQASWTAIGQDTIPHLLAATSPTGSEQMLSATSGFASVSELWAELAFAPKSLSSLSDFNMTPSLGLFGTVIEASGFNDSRCNDSRTLITRLGQKFAVGNLIMKLNADANGLEAPDLRPDAEAIRIYFSLNIGYEDLDPYSYDEYESLCHEVRAVRQGAPLPSPQAPTPASS